MLVFHANSGLFLRESILLRFTMRNTSMKIDNPSTGLKLTLIRGDSSTTTMGSLGCGSGRTVTVRILELITAGGLWRRSTEMITFFGLAGKKNRLNGPFSSFPSTFFFFNGRTFSITCKVGDFLRVCVDSTVGVKAKKKKKKANSSYYKRLSRCQER